MTSDDTPEPTGIDEAERLARIRLTRTRHVGPVTYRDLMARFGSAHAALEALPRLARRGGATAPPAPPSEDAVREELERLADIGARALVLGDQGYPRRLANLAPPPPFIAVIGPTSLDAARAVAIVGSRNASAIGRRFAHDLARTLGEAGVVIVSGLARGIDAAAHHGGLETGTVAALAGGLDQVYPPENRELHLAMAERGALVSERPLGAAPTAHDFPRRNRIVSGLADGVVVVEAAERSGALITARYGLEQNREVMAAPGSPLDPRARGANALIKDGARLIETAEDVLDALSAPPRLDEPAAGPPPFDMKAAALEREAQSVRATVRSLLSPTPTTRDDIVRAAGASVSAVAAALIELELAGEAVQLPGDVVTLSPAAAGVTTGDD